jgi:hypothetical protein
MLTILVNLEEINFHPTPQVLFDLQQDCSMPGYMDKCSRRKAHNQSQFYRVLNLSIMIENHLIPWNYRVGITVHGYADSSAAPWKFQIDETPEAEVLLLVANTECKAIKDRQGLKNGRHRVTLTPLESSFVLTKFRYVYSTHLS